MVEGDGQPEEPKGKVTKRSAVEQRNTLFRPFQGLEVYRRD